MTTKLAEFVLEDSAFKDLCDFMEELGLDAAQELTVCGLNMEKVAELQAKALACRQIPELLKELAKGG